MILRESSLDDREPDHPSYLIAVVANEEEDRTLLSTAIARHSKQRITFSLTLQEAESVLASHSIDSIVGFVDSGEQWLQFKALAGRFPDTLSVLFLSEPERFGEPEDGEFLTSVVGVPRAELVEQAARATMDVARAQGVVPSSGPSSDELDRRRLESLTEREVEILVLTAEGLAIKEIAVRIHRAYATVATHRTAIMEKLGLHDRVALARFAIRCGLIQA